ncbi:MAG: diaminopimelate epimerase [Actinomycetota bacterium]
MQFVKSHGAGNDFVLVEDLDDRLGILPSSLVAAICDRHKGVGGDGLIRIVRATGADFFMDYYNADGEVAEMCGNGVRCLGKYVADRGITTADSLRVDTRAGVKRLELYRDDDGLVDRVRVDMGAPILAAADIPVDAPGDPLHVPVTAEGVGYEAACVSMGNPHAVVFVPSLDAIPVERHGPAIETSRPFPAKTNVEFTEVISPDEVRVRVWERGVGETQACGTGACAVAVAASLRGLTGRHVTVRMPGGPLEIEWTDETVLMTGPVVEVFSGELAPRFERAMPTAAGSSSGKGVA